MLSEHIYIKSDGSLNDGMEIVTHPMTLDYHRSTMPWERLCGKAIHLRYKSHKTTTCGLHIHVNRTAFGETREEHDEAISRVLYFVEHHWAELLKFSRRTEYAMNKWAASGKLTERENRHVDEWLLGGKPKEFYHIEECVDYMLQSLEESEETSRIRTTLEYAKTDGNITGKICWDMSCASGLISRIAVPSDEIERIDDIVRELYNYKLKHSDKHCIVILDEFQDMNMEEKAPIISLLMKKGRKLNISVVLATQFITAGIAQNIHSAVNLCPQKISFSPANKNNTITRMGLAEDERTLLSDLGVGECIAKGCDFATDKDFCRDAVKMKVFYKEQ